MSVSTMVLAYVLFWQGWTRPGLGDEGFALILNERFMPATAAMAGTE